ncbi:Mycothiol acetyltransferase [Lactobacillus helveticus]|uniref:Mycothiol acetyltransferase n=1 Tax=Lactobacillus helveticus TaxID=1587 RepID=A0A9Q5C6W4_LACHE|nr:GNAT family N-acetyltransferase [Lactobacillus helveticus]MDN6032910.1 GNAT family N-acetyltransferase [Lactococcus lactis]NRN79431.1 Mycothiol acetyltransferase [Lactobacillus helveticus]NRN92173.1 Mycothiol acetyltransferase [Lactobacillus helveticus]NRN96501.1 Mycothiol acetyltransferase [Lactobacillus helveticus]NRO15095.1 Mycothiol acetyltransferase [Lactobacillus helveticus]
MTKSTIIRSCKKDENFSEISKLYLKTWKSAYKDLLPQKLLSQLNEKTWSPQKRWQNTLIAENSSNKIIGVCSFGPTRSDMFSNFGEIYSIYIDSEYQHIGIGSQLLKQALDKLIQGGYHSVFLWVIYNNMPAIKFYKKMGFKTIGKTRIDKSKLGETKERAMSIYLK